MTEDAPQRNYSLRDVFDALRYLVRSGCSWRMLPHDFPPHYVVYTQLQRWLKDGAFEAMIHDLRIFLRWAEERNDHPTAAILDSRTLQSTGRKRRGRRVRRGEKTQRAQGPSGGGYAGAFISFTRHARE